MPLAWPSTWKTRLTKRRHSSPTDADQDSNMEPISEGSHERSVGSSSSTGQSTVQLHEELEHLRREVELLKATQTRTYEDSPRTRQIREEMDQLRLDNERLRAKSVTYQDVNRSPGAEQRSGYAQSYRNDQYQFPDGMEPRSVQAEQEPMGHKYVIEAPFAVSSSSKTSRSQSLPKPSAPPVASSTRSLVHSQSIQVSDMFFRCQIEFATVPKL